MELYYFRSDLFSIEPGEDEAINPERYGRKLAAWLTERLQHFGYEIEPIINEDWGRCLMCSRDPFMLWVGCGSVTPLTAARELAKTEDIEWCCFAEAKVPFFRYLFRKQPDTSMALGKLNSDLQYILNTEPGIKIVEQE